ncbi:MAG TPA: porin, partial [Xanthobacteraceae bacterium]
KSLLLGSAAGLVAVAGAQAADLPVKAKPVEYVKVCSLYGAGFWYVPGTDTCLKVGSYVRVQTEFDANGGGIPIGFGAQQTAGRFTRTDTNELAFRTRAALSIDLRTQTEYGTLRSYLEVGAQQTTPTDATEAVFFDRGFIQFAGFTAGRIRSYFDINSMAPYSYANSRVSGDTGASGIYGIAYTAQFGNGVTASLSFEDGGASAAGATNGGGRGHMIANMSIPATTFALGATSFDNKGFTFPDVVGALRIDQAWGYAQIAAALHDASGGYYGTTLTGAEVNGHPGNKQGFAVTGGFTLNNIFGMKGDQFAMQAAYSQGAAGYVTRATGAFQVYGSGHSAGFGWVTDGVFAGTTPANGTAIELTTVWGINGAFQHFWTPKWRTSLYGGYIEVDYDGAATNQICGIGGVGGGVAMTGVTNCSPSFSWWQVGTRTQWNPHPDLDIGVDVLYNKLNTAFGGSAVLAANGARSPGIYAIEDQNVLSVLFRIQRNFLP